MQVNIKLRVCGTMHSCRTPLRIAIRTHMSSRIYQSFIYLCCWYEVWNLLEVWNFSGNFIEPNTINTSNVKINIPFPIDHLFSSTVNLSRHTLYTPSPLCLCVLSKKYMLKPKPLDSGRTCCLTYQRACYSELYQIDNFGQVFFHAFGYYFNRWT